MTDAIKCAGGMGSALPQVAIILVNWNSRADTLECLESVFRLDYPDFKVVVCDNASSDDSIAAIQKWATDGATVEPQSPHYGYLLSDSLDKSVIGLACYTREDVDVDRVVGSNARLVLIEVGSNAGFAGGNNAGMRYALKQTSAQFFWLLNTDTVVEPDALKRLVERAMTDDRLGMTGSSLLYYWEPTKVQGMGGGAMDIRNTRCIHIGVNQPVASIPLDPAEVESKMAYVIGASMLVSRAFVEAVGPMCEDYFLYYEETDWALRAKGRFNLGYAPGSIVYHKVGGSSQRVASRTSMRFLYQNRLKFVARFLPERYLATVLSLTSDMLRGLVKGRWGTSFVIGEALLQARRHYLEESKSDQGWR